MVTDNFASNLSFQFMPPIRFNDSSGLISTTFTVYFDNAKSSERTANSISPSSKVSSSSVVK